MPLRKLLIYSAASVASGIVVTVLTGLYNSTPDGIVGASWYGFPFVWIRLLVVSPQYNPWDVDFLGLSYDLATWVAVFAVVFYVIMRFRAKRVDETARLG